MGAARLSMPSPTAQPRSMSGATTTAVPFGILRTIGTGQPLEPRLRQTMEAFFQRDFSTVRVHQGPAAAAMGALAFTLGEDLHFAPGLYSPSTREGLELLGHELTHVGQQRDGRVINPLAQRVAIVQDPALEAEADQVGRRLAEQVYAQARHSPGLIITHRRIATPTSAALLPRAAVQAQLATTATPGRPRPAGIAHPGPVDFCKRPMAGLRPPGTLQLAPRYDAHRTFVIAPTREAYGGSPKLTKELTELTKMASFDLAYFESTGRHPYPAAIYTGYSEGVVTTDLSQCFSELAELAKNTPITLVFSAHGSPGADGQIGMGEVGDDFRLTAPKLVELLIAKGIKQLKHMDLQVTFHCCNSAYVPGLDRYQEEPARADKVAIIEESFIGAVHSRLLGKVPSLSVTGYRGFYLPDHKTPQVASRKAKYSLTDGSATILSNRDVEFGNWDKFRQIQIQEFEG
jgi:hypothetical protein